MFAITTICVRVSDTASKWKPFQQFIIVHECFLPYLKPQVYNNAILYYNLCSNRDVFN